MICATKAMFDFLKIDLQTGLVFSGMALSSYDLKKRDRVTRSARIAYDTVVSLKHRIPLTKIDADTLDRNLSRLRSELEILGETFIDGPTPSFS